MSSASFSWTEKLHSLFTSKGHTKVNRLVLINVKEEDDHLVSGREDGLIHRLQRSGQILAMKAEHGLLWGFTDETPVKSRRTSNTYWIVVESSDQLDDLIKEVTDLKINQKGVFAVLGGGMTADESLSVEECRVLIQRQTPAADSYLSLVNAAIISAIGLATNSNAAVVASMLVSPLMAPILQVSWAAVDPEASWKFMRRSTFHFMVQTAMCIFIGFATGVIGHYIGYDKAVSKGGFGWPTSEMSSRTEVQGLWPSACVAAVSGVAVANALRQGGLNSLVGVAISASLLPPLVNSGMYVAFGWLSDEDTFKDASGQASVSCALTFVNVVALLFFASLCFRFRLSLGSLAKKPKWARMLSHCSDDHSGDLTQPLTSPFSLGEQSSQNSPDQKQSPIQKSSVEGLLAQHELRIANQERQIEELKGLVQSLMLKNN
eukprot:TRINITY_DN32005_c0_g1_i1.p1 TRINITY_DN32005_c0_g1~~TRINITY_DN32005_c0_g1_i1.p1  ORF type:complete len:433 (+),score=80.17 TRINITY_DN32005_c0_g1_i1:27-1325(+)